MLLCVVVCCCVLLYVVVCCCVLLCVVVCCCVLLYVVVCCCMLQVGGGTHLFKGSWQNQRQTVKGLQQLHRVGLETDRFVTSEHQCQQDE